jgi:hypothetical protein
MPIVLRQTDLPPAFGPDISKIRCSLLIKIFRGTIFFPCSDNAISNTGCRAFTQFKIGLGESVGQIASNLIAKLALALIKSIIPRK